MGGDSFSDIYEPGWYLKAVLPNLQSWLTWYGSREHRQAFFELPHIELRNWKRMRDSGLLALVEPMPEDEPI